jgi:hypothetical protein
MRTRQRQGLLINVEFILVGPVETYTFQKEYISGDDILDPWDSFQSNVFNLYGNVPVILGTLNGVTNILTNNYYPYGSLLPSTGGIFRPTVTF